MIPRLPPKYRIHREKIQHSTHSIRLRFVATNLKKTACVPWRILGELISDRESSLMLLAGEVDRLEAGENRLVSPFSFIP